MVLGKRDTDYGYCRRVGASLSTDGDRRSGMPSEREYVSARVESDYDHTGTIAAPTTDDSDYGVLQTSGSSAGGCVRAGRCSRWAELTTSTTSDYGRIGGIDPDGYTNLTAPQQ